MVYFNIGSYGDFSKRDDFLAPPAERQRSLSNAELSVVCLSVSMCVRQYVCLSRLRGDGSISETIQYFFLFFGMELL